MRRLGADARVVSRLVLPRRQRLPSFITSKASGALAQNRSGGLDRVSRTKATAAVVLRFCTSTRVPVCFFSNA